ncbi:MAG: HesA/MoeB/ThiF family protein [Promethearchaeota archaeon]
MNERDLDRYSRLRAIKDFGYEIHWNLLKDKVASIVGVGGLGMVSAEILARCGIGTLNLFDMDIVNIVNLNRLGFELKDLGLPKVEVISKRIKDINPDVKVNAIHGDIMDFLNEDNFEKFIGMSDVVLMGVDNYPARTFVNLKCIKQNVVLIDAGASRSSLSGHVHVIIPGKTACISCIGKIGEDIKREKGERCTASLPTTMAILASIQAQEALKYLLKFGSLIDYMTFNVMSGKFHYFQTKIDKKCTVCGNNNR